MPDAEHPEPPPEDSVQPTRTATDISESDYHEHADEYMNKMNERAEELAEQRDDVEVEFAVSLCYRNYNAFPASDIS